MTYTEYVIDANLDLEFGLEMASDLQCLVRLLASCE